MFSKQKNTNYSFSHPRRWLEHRHYRIKGVGFATAHQVSGRTIPRRCPANPSTKPKAGHRPYSTGKREEAPGCQPVRHLRVFIPIPAPLRTLTPPAVNIPAKISIIIRVIRGRPTTTSAPNCSGKHTKFGHPNLSDPCLAHIDRQAEQK